MLCRTTAAALVVLFWRTFLKTFIVPIMSSKKNSSVPVRGHRIIGETNNGKGYQPDKTHWTKKQHQEYAYALALESLPAIWDMTSPMYNDMDLVKKSQEKLQRLHQKIFELPQMKSIADCEMLYLQMRSNWHAASYAVAREMGNGTYDHVERDVGGDEYNRRLDKHCSYASAMFFTSPTDLLELELVEQANGLKLITNAFGEQSVRYSDGTVDKMSEMPLCLIKLKLAYEFDRFSEFLMKRKMQLKDRLDCFMFKTEMQLACHLFDTVKAMRDEK